MNFLGRQSELDQLERINELNKASLIVCSGRRRIGKSTLIQKFGEKFTHFIEIQGLAPHDKQTNQDQLDHFAKKFVSISKTPSIQFKDWTDAFSILNQYAKNKKVFIFLDEISWMGKHDPDFAGKLKVAWDTQFKKNNKLRLVLCGSVSSWIEKNILRSKDFMGRISLELHLEELPLNICHQFWNDKKDRISSFEKFQILSITGGIPRYLEEINYKRPAEQNIKDLCFNKNGLLYLEFEKIFNDIFEKRAAIYKKLVQLLASGLKTFSEICGQLSTEPNGAISGYLKDLELSGFISRQYTWDLKTQKKKSNISQYRLNDNYLRFYLKYIEPHKDKIEKNLYHPKGLENLAEYETIMGFQFENLVLHNLESVCNKLKINPSSILNAGTFFQTKTLRQDSCQIDLLIQTKSTLYACEIKFRKSIDKSIITEVRNKINKLKIPKTVSIRPILIYVGELATSVEDEGFFDQILAFSDLLH